MSAPNRLAVAARDFIHPILILLAKTRTKFQITTGDAPPLLPDKPVIFAINHTNSFDTPIAATAISKCYHLRCQILAGKQPLYFTDRLYFIFNGVFWVDRKSKKETSEAKQKLIDYLGNYPAALWFPEGTWNQTDNLLILPMKWGIIDVAAQAGAQIVPVILDYNRQTMVCHVSFGVPITPEKGVDKATAICELRDSMASLRWKQWEKGELLHRDNVNREQLREEMFAAVLEYPPLSWENEKTIVFDPNSALKSAFSHLENLTPCHENAFLFNRHLK